MQETQTPIRVAILGGGGSALAAAFYLTSTEELRRRYHVTVYQEGWRLGGKGASGRNPAHGQRIEEHGLHMFMGWYDNAFRLVRDCYSEWKVTPENPFQRWEDAFEPQNLVSLEEWVEREGQGRWETWNLELPKTQGLPGDGIPVPGMVGMFRLLLGWLRERSKEAGLDARAIPEPNPERPGWYESFVRRGQELSGKVEKRFEEVRAEGLPDTLRRAWMLLRLGVAVARGFLIDVLPYGPKGFDRINDIDFRAWLIRHGAEDDEVNWCAPVRAFYDLAFAYRGGISDKEHADVAAGAALYSLMRMILTYKGAPLWRMKAGMGDTIFTPLYQVLADRGVEFQFFHRVSALRVAPDSYRIQAIELVEQARLKQGPYQPLVTVKGLPCWPSEPHWEQLENGEKLREEGVNFESAWCHVEVGHKSLRLHQDFDLVVLGIPVGALPPLTTELSARSPAWRNMLATSRTVMTRALQLWLTPSLGQLGWTAGSTVLTTYQAPWASWADMSALLPMEDWSGSTEPKTIAYLCDVFPTPPNDDLPLGNPDWPSILKHRVKESAIEWLDHNTGHIWPEATAPNNPNGLNYDLLLAPDCARGKERFDSQYWRINADPWQQYVQTPPGSVKYRLAPDRSGFDNLYLTGDWTLTSINGGSFEATVESGMRAARAICGFPRKISGGFGE
jgi:uncharacterized protein with NAD-binding domain and iron-sulfur cluster